MSDVPVPSRSSQSSTDDSDVARVIFAVRLVGLMLAAPAGRRCWGRRGGGRGAAWPRGRRGARGGGGAACAPEGGGGPAGPPRRDARVVGDAHVPDEDAVVEQRLPRRL